MTSSELLTQYVEQQRAIDPTAAALADALLLEAQIPVGTIVRGDARYAPVTLFEVESASIRRQGYYPDDVGCHVWAFGLNKDGSRQETRYGFPLHTLSPAGTDMTGDEVAVSF